MKYMLLDYQHLKQRAYKMGSKILVLLGFISFLLLFIFADKIAFMIKGDITDGNSISSIAMVIRAISTALLIVPILSVKRGYLQGHKFMLPSQLSAVMEQLVRVVIVVLGSFLALKVFHLGLDVSVSVAVLGATFGALVAYLYVNHKLKKHKSEFKITKKETVAEKKVSNKEIFKKIIFYALPFVLIDIVKSSYSVVDLFTIVRTLTNVGYSAIEAENVIGIISTWASKLNMIVISISVGITASLIPNIMPSFVKKDFKDVNKKINGALQILVILTIPMTVGLSFLSFPVWNAFYGYDEIGISLFSLYIFLGITLSFQSVLVDSAQIMNNTKLSFGSLFLGFLVKLTLNVPLIYFCNFIHIPAYYGSSIASLLSQTTTILFLLWQLKKQYSMEYHQTKIILFKTIVSCLIMVSVLSLLKLIIPITSLNRLYSIILCVIYAIVGMIVYFIVMLKIKGIPKINNFQDIVKIIKRKE